MPGVGTTGDCGDACQTYSDARCETCCDSSVETCETSCCAAMGTCLDNLADKKTCESSLETCGTLLGPSLEAAPAAPAGVAP